MTEIKRKSTEKLVEHFKRAFTDESIKEVKDFSDVTTVRIAYKSLVALPDCLNTEFITQYPNKVTVHGKYYGRFFIIYLEKKDENERGDE